MPRRNLFSVLEDYFAYPNNKKFEKELIAVSKEIYKLALKNWWGKEQNDNIKELEKLISKEANNRGTSERLMQCEKKTKQENEETVIIDEDKFFKVSEEEKGKIDTFLNENIKNIPELMPLSTAYTMYIERRKGSGKNYIQHHESISINSNYIKVHKLKSLSQDYLKHLYNSIGTRAYGMPRNVLKDYKDKDGAIDTNKIISNFISSKNHPFFYNLKELFYEEFEIKNHSLYAALEKYIIVQDLIKKLDKKNTSNEDKIKNFENMLNEKKDDLAKDRDPVALRFFKNVGHVLTLGIVSKITRGTFKFWQSHAETFTENAEAQAPKIK